MKALIIGREKNLAYAELESRFGHIQKQNQAVLVQADSINIDSLGSVQKTTKELEQLAAITPQNIADFILRNISTDSKPIIALSIYTRNQFNLNAYKKLVFATKKLLKQQTINARFILPKQDTALSSAQSFNYQAKNFCECIIVNDQSKFAIGLLSEVQDIQNYSIRDYERPCRDAKVGMLPPKLAQIMINLSKSSSETTLYDPFCGSGVVLQEALLLGYNVCGSDLSQQLVECSKKNIAWLKETFDVKNQCSVVQADATGFSTNLKKYAIITEGYLGKPLSLPPDSQLLASLQTELDVLYSAFLRRLKQVSPTADIVVLATPVWRTKNNVLQSLKTLDHIESLGYTKVQFQSVEDNKLIYMRSQQVVGREITVLLPKNQHK